MPGTQEIYALSPWQTELAKSAMVLTAACMLGITLTIPWLWLRISGRPSPTRLALGLLAAASAATVVPAYLSAAMLQLVRPDCAALLLLVPALSLLALLAGTVWSWLGWQPSGPGLCATCGHNLLADQSCCPECGNTRRTHPSRAGRFAGPLTLLSILSLVSSLWMIALLEPLRIDWVCDLRVDLLDRTDARIASVQAEATVHGARWKIQSQLQDAGMHGFGGSIVDARVLSGWTSITPDKASEWDDGSLNALTEQLSPRVGSSAAEAVTSWARTMHARGSAGSEPWSDAIGTVYTIVTPSRPAWPMMIATMAAGPGAALAALLLWSAAGRLHRRRGMAGGPPRIGP
ncbi:MAG: hypothetical protein EBU31_03365 [Proteobacteria bacterium]|nr:hypothetical protein [Pseudomonadota bacterium]